MAALAALISAFAAATGLFYSAEQARNAEQVQITQRYSQAVDQLTKEGIDTRIGGIYALERIARNSHTDQPTVVEVLSAYVRNHLGPWNNAVCTTPTTGAGAGEAVAPPPEADILAAISVLSRRDRSYDAGSHTDFSFSCLRQNLPGFDMTAADLAGATLAGGNFTGATFYQTRLNNTHSNRAYLGRLDLREATLENGYFVGSTFQDSNLSRANLAGANFGTDEEGYLSNFDRATLENCDASRANFFYANLKNTSLKGANFRGANLSNADLTGADLQGADLTEAKLDFARVDGAHFGGAINANLTATVGRPAS